MAFQVGKDSSEEKTRPKANDTRRASSAEEIIEQAIATQNEAEELSAKMRALVGTGHLKATRSTHSIWSDFDDRSSQRGSRNGASLTRGSVDLGGRKEKEDEEDEERKDIMGGKATTATAESSYGGSTAHGGGAERNTSPSTDPHSSPPLLPHSAGSGAASPPPPPPPPPTSTSTTTTALPDTPGGSSPSTLNGPQRLLSAQGSALSFTDNPAVETPPPPAAAAADAEGSAWAGEEKESVPLAATGSRFVRIAPVVPKASDTAALVLLIGLPVLGFVLGFSAMGYGVPVYTWLKARQQHAPTCVAAALCVAGALYFLDAEYWDGPYERDFWAQPGRNRPNLAALKPLNKARKLGIAAATALVAAATCFGVHAYPYGPLCGFLVLLVAHLVAVKRLLLGKGGGLAAARQYIGSLPLPLLVTSVWLLVWWLLWTNQGGSYRLRSLSGSVGGPGSGAGGGDDAVNENAWSAATKRRYGDAVGCDASSASSSSSSSGDDLDDLDLDLDDVYRECLSPFMLWCAPASVAFALAALALVAYVLDPHDSHGAPKMVGQGLLALLLGMWVAASVKGAGSGVTSALLAFITCGLAGVGGLALFACGADALTNPDKQPFVQKLVAKYGWMGDGLRGLLVATCGPLLAAYFAASALNQLVRRLPLVPCTKQLAAGSAEARGVLTAAGAALWGHLGTWRWTPVLTYALYWGIFFFTCNVVISQFTILFLSWLIRALASLSLGTVSLLFFGVGFVMFMLPPVPGVPVYLSSGIVLVAAARDSLGLSASVAYAFCFCMVLKLLSAVGQMYIFGVPLGRYVSVRRAVGVNSPLVRTMKVVLSEPGLSLAKVAILTGGPDWPTSVMCGILRLDVKGVLCGTLPVALLILPTVLAGAYFYLSGEDPMYQTLATVLAAVAALVQSGSMLVAAYCLDQAAMRHSEALDAMPYDAEVLEAEQTAAARRRRYAAATRWAVLPRPLRALLLAATALMVAACYTVQLAACFEPFELTSSIAKDLPGGRWYRLVKYPQGALALACFAASVAAFRAFAQAAACRAAAWPEEGKGDQEGGGGGGGSRGFEGDEEAREVEVKALRGAGGFDPAAGFCPTDEAGSPNAALA